MAFANSIYLDETAHYGPSHLDLRCLTFSLSIFHINFSPNDSFLQKKKKKKNKKRKKSRRQMSSEIWHRKS